MAGGGCGDGGGGGGGGGGGVGATGALCALAFAAARCSASRSSKAARFAAASACAAARFSAASARAFSTAALRSSCTARALDAARASLSSRAAAAFLSFSSLRSLISCRSLAFSSSSSGTSSSASSIVDMRSGSPMLQIMSVVAKLGSGHSVVSGTARAAAPVRMTLRREDEIMATVAARRWQVVVCVGRSAGWKAAAPLNSSARHMAGASPPRSAVGPRGGCSRFAEGCWMRCSCLACRPKLSAAYLYVRRWWYRPLA